ncbi:MAG: hypothetical protein MUF77_10240, partial [Leptospira sp.]|nr:hypothetical protein [Leptospira sp.]
ITLPQLFNAPAMQNGRHVHNHNSINGAIRRKDVPLGDKVCNLKFWDHQNLPSCQFWHIMLYPVEKFFIFLASHRRGKVNKIKS